ncbi:GlxA family transcriptional regulator [Pelomonas sp. KK5]|uniref:GlxA family transcriptional regulator n=1 Tax=Pelomonas sp. KK5 TaxID=1855730 RepID=UPI00097BBDC7|nr:GlxA family transcriptional regulator [Pelomonas sp. KK5]
MNAPPLTRLRTVHLIVYPGFKALEAIGPMTVFEYANIHLEQRGMRRMYAVSVAAPVAGTVSSDMLMGLEATHALDPRQVPDIAVIAGARNIEQALTENPAIAQWAGAVMPRIEKLVALCSGSYFLAAAGLLEGRRATTHWNHAAKLQQRFPGVLVEADAIYLHEGKLWTSAGVTAGIDLALAIVEEDCGRTIALDVARDMVVYLKRPGGQSQFSVHLESQRTSHSAIRAVQDWILTNLSAALSLEVLASRAAMSERNFRRLFQKEVGLAPAEFIERARLDAARRLLEDGELPIKTIADLVGFTSDQALRKLFMRLLGVSPKDYRERFATSTRVPPV